MKILGIDPGLAIVGFGLIEINGNHHKALDYGKITTDSKTPFPKRIQQIYTDMMTILDAYQPDIVAVEELFFSKNVTTGIQVGHARGVILLAAQQAGCKLYEYTPMQVKQAVTGYGSADKKQVQQMVKILLNLDEVPKPDDVADALAVAITHGNFSKFSNNIIE